ncbi:Uncharacterized protein HZ326_9563 [Fusarium oxysporum f. sp. albedinis]|nr:Uncharacterized protein HZ326_9563 [Fusarium oxysporum f. sp. albedinis]
MSSSCMLNLSLALALNATIGYDMEQTGLTLVEFWTSHKAKACCIERIILEKQRWPYLEMINALDIDDQIPCTTGWLN